jgi:hypothetical protein
MIAASPKSAIPDLNGLPFLDDTFAARRLLAITVALRSAGAARRGMVAAAAPSDAEAWLTPTLAFALAESTAPVPALPLTISRKHEVADALASVAALMPSWQPLLRLPVRYARLHPAHGAISASSRDWPQHVLLAEEAFATSRELREQIVHELAHQWLYLIEDIWPTETAAPRTVTLPSGTGDRRPAEALGAAHVAAALVRMYRADGTAWAAARAQALTSYGLGCLDLAAVSGYLTGAGHLIAQRLKEALCPPRHQPAPASAPGRCWPGERRSSKTTSTARTDGIPGSAR